MNEVLIIGNGFDLAVGLETGYVNYMNSQLFKELLRNQNPLAAALQNEKRLNNWVDIEVYLKKYSNDRLVKNLKQTKKSYLELKKSLKVYLSTLTRDQIDLKPNLEKFIKKFFFDGETFSNNKTVLDFNYTRSLQIYLDKVNSKQPIKTNYKYLFVHGNIDKTDGIIFGVEDYDELAEKHTFLQKSYYGIDLDKVTNALNKADAVYIFGHSLGETDIMYFTDFFSNIIKNEGKKKILGITYYKDTGKDEIYARLRALTENKIAILKKNCIFREIDSSNGDDLVQSLMSNLL